MEITFITPVYLWMLFIIPFLILTHFYGLKYSRDKAIKFANFEALARVTGGHKLSMNLPLLLLRFFTLIFLIFALSGPIFWYTGIGGDFNYAIAIDSSGSMLADDFSPNRLEAAKNAASNFIDSMPKDSKVALLSFSGTTFVKESLTLDHQKVKDSIDKLSVEYSSGTSIGDAIISSTNLLLEEDKPRVVILLTDGQSNVGTMIEKSINYANERYSTVYTIGMGTEAGGKFQDISAISKLDSDSLKLIAQNTGGVFYKAETDAELNSAYKDISQSSTKKIPIKMTIWLIALTFLTLSIEWIFVNTKFRAVP
jgi:Ca-activated chloride channel family protein